MRKKRFWWQNELPTGQAMARLARTRTAQIDTLIKGINALQERGTVYTNGQRWDEENNICNSNEIVSRNYTAKWLEEYVFDWDDVELDIWFYDEDDNGILVATISGHNGRFIHLEPLCRYMAI